MSDVRSAAAWLGVAVLFLFFVVWFWERGPGLDRDDYALYLLHAQSIAEGRPYTDTGFIGTPLDIAPPAQPPGLPLVLAGTFLLAGGFSATAVKIAMALLAGLAVFVPGLYVGRLRGALFGVAVSAFLTIAWATSSIHPESDLGFVALVWSVLSLLDVPDRGPTWRSLVLVLALGTLAMAFRMVGVALIPTVAWFALANHKRFGVLPALPLAVWGVGGVLVLAMAGWSVIAAQLPSDLLHMGSRAVSRLPYYGRAAVPAHLYPFSPDLANDAYHIASLGLTAIGLASWTKTSWRTAAWGFAVSYGSLLLVATAASDRYLMPLYPVLVFGFLHGLEIVVAFVSSRLRAGPERMASRAVAGTAALVVTLSAVQLLGEPRRGGHLAELPDTRSMFDALASFGDDDSSRTRVAFIQPRVLTWSTGIEAMVIPPARPDAIVAELERTGITHVVLDNLGLARGRTARMQDIIDENGCRFELAYSNESYRVFRVTDDC
jgi:hypothetical protein